MPSIFTKIINREIPGFIVAENEEFIAILDIQPNAKGHTLVIPKVEIEYIFALEAANFQRLMDFSRKVALALEKSVSCKRIGVSVIGLEVPHVHVHLIPINEMADMNFQKKKEAFSNQEMTQLAALVASNFEA